jgi:hypothetical protein
MAFRGGGEAPSIGGVGPMAGVVMVFVGLIVVTAIQQFAPTIGGQIERSQPSDTIEPQYCYIASGYYANKLIDCTAGANISVNSEWNTTYNTDFPEAADTYTDNSQMANLLILIVIVSLILAYLIRI